MQGTEKLAQAMQGKRYTAIILASNLTTDVVTEIRNGYETIYSQLSPMSTQQLAYSTNESLANAINRSKGVTQGKTKTQTIGESHTNGTSNSHSKSDSETKKSKIAVGSSVLGGVLAVVGTGLTITGVGAAIGLPLMAAGGAMSAVGAAGKVKQVAQQTRMEHRKAIRITEACLTQSRILRLSRTRWAKPQLLARAKLYADHSQQTHRGVDETY